MIPNRLQDNRSTAWSLENSATGNDGSHGNRGNIPTIIAKTLAIEYKLTKNKELPEKREEHQEEASLHAKLDLVGRSMRQWKSF